MYYKKVKDKLLRSKENPNNYAILQKMWILLNEDGIETKYFYIRVGNKIKLLHEIIDEDE